MGIIQRHSRDYNTIETLFLSGIEQWMIPLPWLSLSCRSLRGIDNRCLKLFLFQVIYG